MSENRRILLTGGGTAGHVSPALAVAAAADPTNEYLYVGTWTGLERQIVDRAGVPYAGVEAGAVRGRSPIAAVSSLARIARGIGQAREVIGRYRPDAVLATGGFVCVPVVLAARMAGVPTVVYLPDLRPGWAVRFLSRFATVVAVSFEEVVPFIPAHNVVVTGYPVRPEILSWTPERARQHLRLPADAPIVLVLGGSRGARSINDAIASSLETLLGRAWVIHASGATPQYDELLARQATLPVSLRERYRLSAYLDADLAPSLAAATLVVSRAGASVLGELPAVGVPGLLIPYPHAGAHQYLNAKFLADRGAAVVVDDRTAQEGGLVAMVLELLDDPQRRQALAMASRQLARPDAASRLGQVLADLANATPSSSPKRRPA